MTTEEMLAEALRACLQELHCTSSNEKELHEMEPGEFAYGHWCPRCDEYVDRNGELRAQARAALTAYDQARAGQQQTGQMLEPMRHSASMGAKCGCLTCKPDPQPPPDAGSVGQAAGIEALMLAGVESLRPYFDPMGHPILQPDPQPARLVLSKTVLKTLALQGPPAPKCQTCDNERWVPCYDDGGDLIKGVAQPCPDCSKPTGGTP